MEESEWPYQAPQFLIEAGVATQEEFDKIKEDARVVNAAKRYQQSLIDQNHERQEYERLKKKYEG